MRTLVVAGWVVAPSVVLSARGRHDDTANTSFTVRGTATAVYPPTIPAVPAPVPRSPATASSAAPDPPPATGAGMGDTRPPTARTRP